MPPELHERIRGLQKEYDSHQHEKLGPTGNAALTDRWGLTEWLAERFAIAGTAEQCADTVAAAMAAGARQFVLTGIVHDPREFIDRCRRDLLGRTWPSLAPGPPAPPTIRPYRAEDFDPVNDLWRRARVMAFPDFQARKGHPAQEDRAYFGDVISAKNAVWVAEAGGRPVAFMAIAGDFIDQLYVAPGHQRRGIGRALIAHARRLSPQGLRLFTFQSNAAGRAFYEKEGFVATRLGVSPPPESEPDVEYRWTP